MVNQGIRSGFKLLRLWALYGKMDLLWVARDLKMFLMWTFADGIMSVASITAMWLLSERFGGLGVWTRPQVLFLLGYGAVATGLVDGLFGYNISYISRRLGRGQLDHLLIQPQPIWMALLTEGFVPFSGAAILLPGALLLAGSIYWLHLPLSVGWCLLLALNLLASMTVLLSVQFLWGSLAFWSPRAAEEISSSTMRLMTQLVKYPLDGLGSGLLGGLLALLPVGFMAWVPCRALVGVERAGWGLWITPLAALCFAIVAYWGWVRGMVQYGHVGSQRYLGRGHRS